MTSYIFTAISRMSLFYVYCFSLILQNVIILKMLSTNPNFSHFLL